MINSDVLKIVRETLNKEINEDTLRENTPEWDSLKHLQIIMEIEEKLGKVIPIEKVPDIHSVKDILDVLKIRGEIHK